MIVTLDRKGPSTLSCPVCTQCAHIQGVSIPKLEGKLALAVLQYVAFTNRHVNWHHHYIWYIQNIRSINCTPVVAVTLWTSGRVSKTDLQEIIAIYLLLLCSTIYLQVMVMSFLLYYHNSLLSCRNKSENWKARYWTEQECGIWNFKTKV